MTFTSPKYLGSIGILLGALLMQVGCAGEEAAFGRAIALDKTTQALISAELDSVNGTYGGSCRNRSGSWSIEISPGATLQNPALSVVLNDAACVLTMTSLNTDGGFAAAVPAITLTDSYSATASAFGTPVEFYANAKLSAVTFANDFVLTLPFSDDPALAARDNYAAFSVVVATAAAESVDAPNFALDVAGLLVWTDVNDVVQSVTGTADLAAGSVTGQRYVVVNAAGLDTYAKLDAAYSAGTDAALTLAIPTGDFTLVGADLTGSTTVRTLIIANILDGVAAYQAFAITFHPAP